MPDHDEIPMIMERKANEREDCPMLAVGFGLVPTENKKKSAEAGHPVFEDREWCKVMVPADKQSMIFQPATDADRRNYPRAYALFKSREAGTSVEGFPIEKWPQITRSEAMTLKAAGVPTVEALEAVHDGNIDKIGTNGRELRAKAKAFLALAKDTAAAQKIESENESLRLLVTDMQRQIKELAAMRADEQTEERRGPGRPRKAEAA